LFGQKKKGRLLPLGWLAAKHAPSRFGGHGHARKARTAAMPPGQNRTSFCSVSGFLDSASIFFGGFPPLRRHHGEAQNGGFFVHAIGRQALSNQFMSHPFVAMKHLFFGHIFLKILFKRPTSTIVFEMRQRNLTFFPLLAGSDV
jgi:hypothetical protein